MKIRCFFLGRFLLSAPIDLLARQLADAPLTPQQHVLWQELCSELVLARVRIQELETRLKVLERTAADESPSNDVLTRPEFNREVARMLAFDERYGGVSSVIYFDIENLDRISDRHGRTLVEASIRCICDTLLACIRRSDILGRLATDEFGVLLPRCDNESAWKKGEQMASAVFEALTDVLGPGLRPNVTYGAYTFQEKEDVAIGLRQAASSVTRLVKE